MAIPADAGKKMALILAACASLVGSGALIAREGWVLKGGPDPVVGKKLPTACAGVTKGVVYGRDYTEAECIQMTMNALIAHAGPIAPCLPDWEPLPSQAYVQEQIDLTYNIGTSGYLKSTMCRQMRAKNYVAACEAILEWKKAGGQDCSAPDNHTCPGLWASRLKAHDKCLKAIDP